MNEIYDLRKKLCDELKEYGKKEMSAGALDVVDKLAHAIKNIDKIIERGEYSNGRYSRGYSYRDRMLGDLRSYMDEAPDERTRQEIHSFMRRVENM
jgi:hypothetical protein